MALQLGDSGPAVEALQNQLLALSFPLATDGFFGPYTDDAVRGFQSVVGLTPDGIVGPLTEAALAANQWQFLEDNAITSAVLQRRVTTDTATSTLVTTTLEADIKWPLVVLDNSYAIPDLTAALDDMAHGWIDDLAGTEPVSNVGSTHHINGELETTLLAPSLVGTGGVLSKHIAGAVHPNPLIVTANLDLAADTLIPAGGLFMPGTAWLARLREIVLFTFAPAPGIDPVPANYQHLSVTPDGIRIHLYPEQVGLPLAAGVQTVNAQWAKIEGEIRPSIPARAVGHIPGGPGPIVP